MELYREQIIDLAKNPINRREMQDATVTHSGVNVTCGDHVRLYLKIEGNEIAEVSWEGEGCAISVAAASVLTDHLKSMQINDASALQNDDVFSMLEIQDLGPARVKCAVLCLETLHGALQKL